MTVTSAYDPMLAKVTPGVPTAPRRCDRLDAALAETVVLGVTTNIAFLRTLLADPDVQAGRLDTTLVERVAAASSAPGPARIGTGASLASAGATAMRVATRDLALPHARQALAAAALARLLTREPAAGRSSIRGTSPTDGGSASRAWTKFRFAVGAGRAGQEPWPRCGSAGLRRQARRSRSGDGDPGDAARAEFRDGSPGRRHRPAHHLRGAGAAVRVRGRRGDDLAGARRARVGADRGRGRRPLRGGRAAGGDGTVRSPMPGTVLAVHVAPGDTVSAGQAVAVVEAMKMEHTVTAPVAGTVAEVTAKAGQQVAMDARLAVIEAAPEDGRRTGMARSLRDERS